MSENKFSIKQRLKSFRHASNGFRILIKEEHNARVHILAALLVSITGLTLQINQTEWYVIIILIGWILSMELLNSAIENICDLVSPEHNMFVKKAKDLAAAAVLVSAVAAVIIGASIFLPKLLTLLKGL